MASTAQKSGTNKYNQLSKPQKSFFTAFSARTIVCLQVTHIFMHIYINDNKAYYQSNSAHYLYLRSWAAAIFRFLFFLHGSMPAMQTTLPAFFSLSLHTSRTDYCTQTHKSLVYLWHSSLTTIASYTGWFIKNSVGAY